MEIQVRVNWPPLDVTDILSGMVTSPGVYRDGRGAGSKVKGLCMKSAYKVYYIVSVHIIGS